MNEGKVVIDVDRVVAALDALDNAVADLRIVLTEGFTAEVQPTKHAPSTRPASSKPMPVTIDISRIEWMGKNREKVGTDASWAWAFAYDRDGDVMPETAELLRTLERYGKEKIKAKGEIEAEKPELDLPVALPSGRYHHKRIRNPAYFDATSFRVITFNKGIKATIGCPKGKFKAGKCTVGTQIQKLLFPKDRYTKKEALEWVKKHPKLKLRKKK